MHPFCFCTKSLRAILVLCSILFSASSSGVQEPSDNTITYESEPSFGGNENVQSMDDEALKQALKYLQETLSELEVQHGPFHVSITENLLNLAQIYSALDEHKQARSAIERALEVQRISFGLYGAGQIPIVEQLILVNRTLEKWSDINKNYELLYWLYRRVYGENAPELMPLLGHFIDWKIEAINGGLFGNRLSLIRDALSAAKRANSIIESHPELQPMSPYYSQLEKSLQEANKAETTQNRQSF